MHQIMQKWNVLSGLSLDWSRNGQNVYWTSGTSSGRISVVSQNGGNSYTLKSGLDNPRGLKILALEEYDYIFNIYIYAQNKVKEHLSF